jgi:hypothetical protein
MIVRESISFERGLDPKASMNLGTLQQIINYASQKIKEEDWSWASPGGWLWEIQEDPQIDKRTKNSWLMYLAEHREYLRSRELLQELEKRTGVQLVPVTGTGKTYEAINFERGLSPKTSMSIGIKEKIRAFMEEFGNNTEEHWLSDLIQKNLHSDWSDSLDDEARIAWINYLLKTPGEWLKNLDENDYVQMKEEGIEWIPYIPIPGNDFRYQRMGVGDNYLLKFNGWEEFSSYFDTGRDLSLEFIENVLSGDAHDDFYYDSDAFDVTDLGWHVQRIINKGEEVPAMKDLKEKAIEMGGNPENMETVDDLLEEINNNDDLHDLRQAVLFAFMDAQESADESAAYRSLINAIQKWYEIGEGKWHESGGTEIFVAPITKKGLEKLFYSIMTGDDKIKYYPPDHGFNGDITKDDINDALYNKIEDL